MQAKIRFERQFLNDSGEGFDSIINFKEAISITERSYDAPFDFLKIFSTLRAEHHACISIVVTHCCLELNSIPKD